MRVAMAPVEGEIIINRPVQEVFDFVAGERKEPRYNPRMLSVEQISDGPIGAGTRFHTRLKAIGLTLRWSFEFESVPAGTRMCWSWDVGPRGAMRVMTTFVGVTGRRQEHGIGGNLMAARWDQARNLTALPNRVPRGCWRVMCR